MVPGPDGHRRTLLLGALALALPARGGELLRVAGAPFARVYERDDSGFSGMGPEIVRALCAQLGIKHSFAMYPWRRAQAMVMSGQADLLVGPYKTPERQETIAFSERAFYQDDLLFYSRAESAFAWGGNLRALRGKRIVVVNGWSLGEQFDLARKELDVSVSNSVESALSLLALGRVDLFATNRRNTEPLIATLGLGGRLATLDGVISTQAGYFGFPRLPEHDANRQRFDRAFNAYVDAGELRRLGRRLQVQIP